MNITSARLEFLRQAQAAAQGEAGAPPTEPEQLAREALRFTSWVMHYDHQGIPSMRQIPRGSMVLDPGDLPAMIAEPMSGNIPRPLLLPIIQACLRRLGLASAPAV